MSKMSKDDYLLGAGIFASTRLDAQYHIIVQTLGGHLLDPCIPRGASDLKIADVCCGTGYFFRNLDIDSSAPELHAFDIDPTNLPADPWLPNVKRHVWNIYDTPPAELVSTFDIVNCQLLYLFVSDDAIDKVLGNITSLLKPGGHIQWFEISAIGEEIISPDPTYKSQFLSRLTNAAFRASGITNRAWPHDLDKVFARHGLTIINDHRARLEPRNYKSWTLQFISAHEEVKAHVQRSLKETDSEERKREVQEYVDLVGQAFWEAHTNKCAYVHPFIRVVGRKEV